MNRFLKFSVCLIFTLFIIFLIISCGDSGQSLDKNPISIFHRVTLKGYIGANKPIEININTNVKSKENDRFLNYLKIFIKDEDYKNEIIKDKDGVEALLFFYENGYAELLLDKKISIESIKVLHDILKEESPCMVREYVYNSIDLMDKNVIALILQSNLLDWDVAMSAYICRSFNIPYIIISNRDGSFVNTSGNMLKLSLDREDNAKKLNSPMYYLLSPVYRELEFARTFGDSYRVKTDMAKKEILQDFGRSCQRL